MKSRMLFFGLILGICLPSAMAQDIDVTQLTADTKTFIFSNNKNTVKGYIYAALEKETSCCGSDRIYLEVRIDPSGYVTQAKTLTGKNDCFKQSAIDIVKNVKWNAKDFKREKSVYFEIKPDVDCDGAKENNYAQIEIFNNELLDKEGNRVYAGNAPAGSEPTSVSSAATNTKPVEVASTNISTPASTATKPAATGTPPVVTPTATAATTTAPTGAAAQPIASSEGATRSNTTTPVASSEADFLKAKERVELERNVKDEEIRILKEQMDAARAREDEVREREKNLREEKARRDRERENRDRQQESESFASKDDGSEGGLFFDGGNEGGRSAPDQGGDGRLDQGGDPAASADQRAREEIARLEQQKRELENKGRDRDNRLRNQEREDQLAAQEMLRIEQQILDKQEQMAQDQDRRELDKLEQDRRRAEEEQRKYEEEVRRMMDEIGRLQAESERKMQELERQKEEMTRLAQLRIQREQEQVLQRQVRETEKQAKLEKMRLAAAGSGTSVRSVGPLAGPNPTNFVIPPGDSASKLDLILMQLQMLQNELQRVQANMSILSGGGSIAPTQSGGQRGTGLSPQRPVVTPTIRGAKNAGTDKSWQKIDNGVGGGTRGGNGGAYTPPLDPSRFDAVRGYSPELSHKESFANTQVQRFPSPTSGQGQGNMKNYIKEELRQRGVCGLAQSLAEVTIAPKGDVTRFNIIKANNIQVSGALPAILTGMKFEPSNLDVPYVSYIEFKAEILCEGQDRINIREVDDYLQGRP